MKSHPYREADIIVVPNARISRTADDGLVGLVHEHTEHVGTLWSNGTLTVQCNTVDGYHKTEIEIYESECEWWRKTIDVAALNCAAGN